MNHQKSRKYSLPNYAGKMSSAEALPQVRERPAENDAPNIQRVRLPSLNKLKIRAAEEFGTKKSSRIISYKSLTKGMRVREESGAGAAGGRRNHSFNTRKPYQQIR